MGSSLIYVVSDSVGETAELVTKAAVSQFINSNVTIKEFLTLKIQNILMK